MSNTKFTVTLACLRKAGACTSGYNMVVRALQGMALSDDDMERETYIRFAHKDPISIRAILDSNGIDDALWALRCIENADKDRDVRLFAVWCARQVEPLMDDQRSRDALDVAERHANGDASDDDLAAAWAAALGAAWDAALDDARGAARGAAFAAARGAAWDAARGAARGAAFAAEWAAACGPAWDAARGAQKDMLIKMLEGNAPWQTTGGKS